MESTPKEIIRVNITDGEGTLLEAVELDLGEHVRRIDESDASPVMRAQGLLNAAAGLEEYVSNEVYAMARRIRKGETR